MKRKHPIQPIAFDEEGVARFVQNRIVRFLLDQYRPGLNDLYVRSGTLAMQTAIATEPRITSS